MINNTGYYNKICFGSHKKFKKMFDVCAYSGKAFEQFDRKSLDHIVPKIKGGKKELSNLIVVKRSINQLKSGDDLKVFMEKYPFVEKNLLKTLKKLKGKIIDGVNWHDVIKKKIYELTKREVFK